MRVLAWVPIAALATLAVLAWIALGREPEFAFEFEEPPARAALPEPELPPGEATLEGVVETPEGEPAEEALVAWTGGERLAWTRTDGEGRFRLEAVPRGALDVLVLATGHPPCELAAESGAGPVRLVLVPAVRPPPRLAPVERSDLSGFVESSLAGPGDRRYEVVLTPLGPPSRPGAAVPRRAATDADGSFGFSDLAHGTYRVTLLPHWARGGTWPDIAASEDGVPLVIEHPAARDERPELVLAELSGEIRGRLAARPTAVETLGEPRPGFVEGALVIVRSTAGAEGGPRVWPPVVTDAEGGFLVRHLPAGRYLVEVTAGALATERAVVVQARSTTDLDL